MLLKLQRTYDLSVSQYWQVQKWRLKIRKELVLLHFKAITSIRPEIFSTNKCIKPSTETLIRLRSDLNPARQLWGNQILRTTYESLILEAILVSLKKIAFPFCLIIFDCELIVGEQLTMLNWRCSLRLTRTNYMGLDPTSFQDINAQLLILLLVRLTTGPKPVPKRALHIVRSRASSFKLEYPLLSLRPSSRCLGLLPRLPVTSILPFQFSFNNLL